MKTYSKIMGITFALSANYVKVLKRGSSLILEREPTNKFDKNAVKIFDMNEQFLGYVAAPLAKKLAPRMDAGVSFSARVSEVTGGTEDKPNIGCNYELIREPVTGPKICSSCQMVGGCICNKCSCCGKPGVVEGEEECGDCLILSSGLPNHS